MIGDNKVVTSTMITTGAKKTSEYTLELSFAAKDTETIKTLLKNKIGKKYRRMKR